MSHKLASLALLAALAAPLFARAQPVDAKFQYKLSSTTGVIPFHGFNAVYDPYGKETLVYGSGRVHVFNPSGMEVFQWGDDPAITGGVQAVAPTENGDYVVLGQTPDELSLNLVNFRGEFKSRITLSGLPPEIPAPFRANAVGWAKDRIYLADMGAMRVVVVGMDGSFQAFHDLAKLCELEDKRSDNGVRGFRVTRDGDILFTVPTVFRAFVLRADGKFEGFGIKGSAPGKFNVITGIDRDERGYYYVADILKSAVLVFDKDYRFLKEFGYRGNKPGSLFAPVDLVAGGGKLYVSQFARKGVSVFDIEVPEAR